MPYKIIVDKLTSMRNKLIYHNIRGEYKEYVQLKKEFAKTFISYPNEAQYIPQTHCQVNILSRAGINIIKMYFKELFRKKTPNELEMERLTQEIKDKRTSGWMG